MSDVSIASEAAEDIQIERPQNVRLAGPADEAALYDLLMALDADNSFGIPYDPDRVRAAIRRGTRRQGSIIGIIDGKRGEYGEAGELAASISLILTQFWYASTWYLAEQWLFVRPEYRHNRLERDLFNFARWCRAEMNRENDQKMFVVTSVSSPARLPAKLRLWAQHGKQIGGIFVLQ